MRLLRIGTEVLTLSFICLCIYVAGRESIPHAQLRCVIKDLPMYTSTTSAQAACGLPLTVNAYGVGSTQIEQWVYDAKTFLWFRDKRLEFYRQ